MNIILSGGPGNNTLAVVPDNTREWFTADLPEITIAHYLDSCDSSKAINIIKHRYVKTEWTRKGYCIFEYKGIDR